MRMNAHVVCALAGGVILTADELPERSCQSGQPRLYAIGDLA